MTVFKTRKWKWNGFRPVLGSEQLIGVSPGSFCLWYTVGQEDHRCQQQQFWAHLEKLKQAGEIWENICSNKETALPLSHKSETQRSKEWQVTFELIWCSNTQYVWQDWQGDPVHLWSLQHPTHPPQSTPATLMRELVKLEKTQHLLRFDPHPPSCLQLMRKLVPADSRHMLRMQSAQSAHCTARTSQTQTQHHWESCESATGSSSDCQHMPRLLHTADCRHTADTYWECCTL